MESARLLSPAGHVSSYFRECVAMLSVEAERVLCYR
jgi:hypothetical protein